jgi:hypothetical protein
VGPQEPERGDATSAEPVGDTLPEDLDVTQFVGPTVFPNITRRRIPGALYALLAVICAGAWIATENVGVLLAGVLLALIAVYHFATAWNVVVDETEALLVASRTVGFAVGHASAQLAWRGLRSRPAWRILLYSADEPPSMRGLVELDAVDGHVLGDYTEPNPEDWSKFGLGG